MSAKNKAHPGVLILKRTLPSGRTAWQGRYRDPETTQTKKPMLTGMTQERRKRWAIEVSRNIAGRRLEIEAGSVPRKPVPLAKAVKAYLEHCEGERLRPNTMTIYTKAAEQFVAWAGKQGIKTTAEFNGPVLARYRGHLTTTKKKAAKSGAKRGERKTSAAKLAPSSVNMKLRATKGMLSHWRINGLAPQLTQDVVGGALKAMRVPKEEPAYLEAADLLKLLAAATRHDAETFTETRTEHAGRGTPGRTGKYQPIGGFVAFLLLTGCRRGEALALRWSDVKLDAEDHDGRKVGVIKLRAAITKTNEARTVGLDVTPGLRALLAAMRLRHRGPGYVFGGAEPYTVDLVEAARGRLTGEYGAPAFDWQMLRSTCATYATNAEGLWGDATVFRSAKRLGHSVAVAEKHYLSEHRGVPKKARTLEAAMKVESELSEIVDTVASSTLARPRRTRGLRAGAEHAGRTKRVR